MVKHYTLYTNSNIFIKIEPLVIFNVMFIYLKKKIIPEKYMQMTLNLHFLYFSVSN